MRARHPRTLLLTVMLCATATAQAPGQQHQEGRFCPHVITDMVPGLVVNLSQPGLAHVEVRHCDPVGPPMQVVAWKEGASSPSLVLDIARFSYGPLLMAGNVFAMVFPGPYDSIVVIQYQHGEPRVVFTDSTHAEIWLATTNRGVEVTLDYGNGKKAVRTFAVDENELVAAPPH